MFYDQASGLRKKIQTTNVVKSNSTKVITVTSGKGGVGKSNFTLNFALALIENGHRSVVLDADIGLANIDVLMGIAPKYTLLDMFRSHKSIWEIMEKGPNGLEFIAGGSELESIFDLKKNNLPYLLDQLMLLNGEVDTLLIDTGAGLSQESLKFILSSDEVIVVTTPEPTAITDSYAMIKIILSKNKNIKINLIINQVLNDQEGNHTFDRIKLVTERFLDYKIGLLGFIYSDEAVSKAVRKQEPYYISFPNSKAAKSIKLIADKFTNRERNDEGNGVKAFLDKMSHFFRNRG